MPTHKITELNKKLYEEKVKDYKEQIKLEAMKSGKPRQVEPVKEPNHITLHEKQQIILAKARFYQHFNHKNLNATQKSRAAGWLRTDDATAPDKRQIKSE